MNPRLAVRRRRQSFWKSKQRHRKEGLSPSVRRLGLEVLEDRRLLSGVPPLIALEDPNLETSGDMYAGFEKEGTFAGEETNYGVFSFAGGFPDGLLGTEGSFWYEGSSIPIEIAPTDSIGDVGDPVTVTLNAFVANHASGRDLKTATFSYFAGYDTGQESGTLLEGTLTGPSAHNEVATFEFETTVGAVLHIGFSAEGSTTAVVDWDDPVFDARQGFALWYLVGILPDIAMLSATNQDSESVQFEYQISGYPIEEFQVGVYRSEDDNFDPGVDIQIGEMTISEASVGTHTGEWHGALPPDPSHPHVLVVADPGNNVFESDETNNVIAVQGGASDQLGDWISAQTTYGLWWNPASQEWNKPIVYGEVSLGAQWFGMNLASGSVGIAIDPLDLLGMTQDAADGYTTVWVSFGASFFKASVGLLDTLGNAFPGLGVDAGLLMVPVPDKDYDPWLDDGDASFFNSQVWFAVESGVDVSGQPRFEVLTDFNTTLLEAAVFSYKTTIFRKEVRTDVVLAAFEAASAGPTGGATAWANAIFDSIFGTGFSHIDDAIRDFVSSPRTVVRPFTQSGGAIPRSVKPDLMPDYYEVPLDWALPGDEVLLYNDVQNIGGGNATDSFDVDHFLYDYDVVNDWYLGSRRVSGGLNSGAVNTADSLPTLPPGLSPGTYWLGMFVDFDNTVPEVDDRVENNLELDWITIPFVQTANLDASGHAETTATVADPFERHWYIVEAPASGEATLNVNASVDFDPALAVYAYDAGRAGDVLLEKDNGAAGEPEIVAVGVTAGTRYVVEVRGFAASSGGFALSMDWPATPEITVLGNSVSITDGDTTPGTADHTDFGSVGQGQPGPTRTYKLRNDGGATLTLAGVIVPTGYTLTEGLSTSLVPEASDTFTVRLDTATGGTKTGEISFSNNDSDENPFNFQITGTVNPEPPQAPPWQNLDNHFDVSGDGVLAPQDALLLANFLYFNGQRQVPDGPGTEPFPVEPPPYYDVSGDNFVTVQDALLVVWALRNQAAPEAEGEELAAETTRSSPLFEQMVTPWMALGGIPRLNSRALADAVVAAGSTTAGKAVSEPAAASSNRVAAAVDQIMARSSVAEDVDFVDGIELLDDRWWANASAGDSNALYDFFAPFEDIEQLDEFDDLPTLAAGLDQR